jgi:hypothetical protein
MGLTDGIGVQKTTKEDRNGMKSQSAAPRKAICYTASPSSSMRVESAVADRDWPL